jgi:voltage-gated sodium channel
VSAAIAAVSGDTQPLRVFDKAILLAIVANSVVLVWGLVDHAHEELLDPVHEAFLVMFTAELGVRLHRVGWNVKRFLRAPWNTFDALVIGLALAPALGLDVTLLRVARLARMVHALRHVSHLRAVHMLWRLRTKPATVSAPTVESTTSQER